MRDFNETYINFGLSLPIYTSVRLVGIFSLLSYPQYFP